MAADWLKMRIDLQSHPKVVRILSATCTDKFRVIGGLHAVWGVFDVHSEDGVLHGYTPELMDQIIGWSGFSQAMIDVGWLRFDGEQALDMPEFSEHNGQSAKRRAEDQKRKRNGRNNVRNLSAIEPDEMRTKCGPEKRREEKKDQELVTPNGVTCPPQAPDPKFERCPVQEIVSLYHAELPTLPRLVKLTSARAGAIRQRWREDLETLDDWRAYFADVRASPFLMGRVQGRDGRKPFRASLPWLVKSENFAKVAEGKYHEETA